MAILDANEQYTAFVELGRNDQPVWGGKKEFEKFNAGKLSKSEWDSKRLRPIRIQGQANRKSNRLFDFLQLHKQILIYKPNKDTRIPISFKIGFNQKRDIEYLVDNIGVIPITVTLKQGQICFSFEQEKVEPVVPVIGRTMGIDLNPSSVGCTISDLDNFDTEIFSQLFQMTNKTRQNANKRKHETIQIAHRIVAIARHFHVQKISMENLTMGAANANKGRRFNRLVNNEWNRELIQWTISKLCSKFGIKLVFAYCQYSSTIGNVLHRHLADACASAKEIGRRASCSRSYESCINPPTNFESIELLTQWKDEGVITNEVFSNWKELHIFITKTRKLKYRVPITSIGLRFYIIKSGVTVFSYH